MKLIRNLRGGHLFKDVPPETAALLRAVSSFPNPAYESAKKFSRFSSTNVPRHIRFLSEEDGDIEVGRAAYFVDLLPPEVQHKLWHECWERADRIKIPQKWPKPKLTPNAEQASALKALDETLEEGSRPHGNLLVYASTSVGKTIMLSLMARRLGQATMVMVHTDQILLGWYEDLYKLFGLRRDDIGLIKAGSTIIRRPITLVSAKTMDRRQDSWAEFNRCFGTVVLDEVQNVGSSYIYNFLAQSTAKYILGATGTESSDGKPNWRLRSIYGNPIIDINTYGVETSNSMPVSEAVLIETNFEYEGQADNIDQAELNLTLACDDARNRLIVQHAKSDWQEGKVVLIVTKSLEHVNLLVDMLKEAGVENVNAVTGETNKSRFYNLKLRKAVADGKVTMIVASLMAFQQGANVPKLDCLHLAIPPANPGGLEQIIGRIRRKAEGKTEAIIRYYYDRKVGYLAGVFRRVALPVFRKMKIPGWTNVF